MPSVHSAPEKYLLKNKAIMAAKEKSELKSPDGCRKI
jgi:hypothetical protein